MNVAAHVYRDVDAAELVLRRALDRVSVLQQQSARGKVHELRWRRAITALRAAYGVVHLARAREERWLRAYRRTRSSLLN